MLAAGINRFFNLGRPGEHRNLIELRERRRNSSKRLLFEKAEKVFQSVLLSSLVSCTEHGKQCEAAAGRNESNFILRCNRHFKKNRIDA